MPGWLVASCALALIGSGSLPSAALGQDSAPKGEASKTGAHETTAHRIVSKTAASKSHTTSPSKAHSSASTSQAKATSRRGKSTQPVARRKGKRRTTARGQQKIDSERAQEIQQALIREHYLTGEATGTWNQASEDAMRRYQADHGWQSKTVPDARALISLGLGPRHDHLLNPESAMTTEPVPPQAASLNSAPPASAPASESAAAKTSSAPASDPPPATSPAHDPSSPQ